MQSASLFTPTTFIFPVANIRAVEDGFLILMTTAGNLFGLYSVFLARVAISLRFSLQSASNVETILETFRALGAMCKVFETLKKKTDIFIHQNINMLVS
jgi:hypothetical protein